MRWLGHKSMGNGVDGFSKVVTFPEMGRRVSDRDPSNPPPDNSVPSLCGIHPLTS